MVVIEFSLKTTHSLSKNRTIMSIHSLCKPRPSVFAADRRATVLSLDTFLKGQVNGSEFFEENFFTNGMLTLVDRAFRQLGGSGAGSSVFLLSQAMGGGKTHSMIALGLLARDPELRKRVLGEQDPAPKLGRCRVVGFNRSTEASGGISGDRLQNSSGKLSNSPVIYLRSSEHLGLRHGSNCSGRILSLYSLMSFHHIWQMLLLSR
jgi:hypothetical protein